MIKRNADFVSREVADEMVLVPVTRDAADLVGIFTLNEVGAFIWGLLEEETTEDAVAAAICEEFEVSPEQAREDLSEFLAQLDEIGALLRG
jgi:hypothetical protein